MFDIYVRLRLILNPHVFSLEQIDILTLLKKHQDLACKIRENFRNIKDNSHNKALYIAIVS